MPYNDFYNVYYITGTASASTAIGTSTTSFDTVFVDEFKISSSNHLLNESLIQRKMWRSSICDVAVHITDIPYDELISTLRMLKQFNHGYDHRWIKIFSNEIIRRRSMSKTEKVIERVKRILSRKNELASYRNERFNNNGIRNR